MAIERLRTRAELPSDPPDDRRAVANVSRRTQLVQCARISCACMWQGRMAVLIRRETVKIALKPQPALADVSRRSVGCETALSATTVILLAMADLRISGGGVLNTLTYSYVGSSRVMMQTRSLSESNGLRNAGHATNTPITNGWWHGWLTTVLWPRPAGASTRIAFGIELR